MRFKEVLAFSLILSSHIVSGELQGPLAAQIRVETLDGSNEPTDKDDSNRRTHSVDDSDEVAFIDNAGLDNERKSSPYVEHSFSSDFITTEGEVNPHLLQKIPILDQIMKIADVEKIVNDKKALIEELQAELDEKNKPVEPTAEEIEAQEMYEKAMDMLTKLTGDKRVPYTLIRKAAEMKHAKARAELAWAHLFGHWVELDYEFAAKEFDELARDGLPEANMGLAFLHSVGVGGKNVSQPLALIHLTMAAADDNTFAQMALAYRYSYGINVPMSCELSLSFYKKVAKKVASKITFSSGPAVHRVHLLDESENPGSQESEIVDYYQLLADKGDVQSQVGLGQLYYQGGKAIQQDHQKALEYFTQAANSGNAIGYAFLGKLYLEGGENIKADNETAFRYFKRAADLGDPVGQSGLGLMYLKGLGVPKDSLKALNYFTQAADQGWVDGQLQLGNMYFTGNGVKTDYKLAFKYFNLASQSGHVLAYYNLGIMHAYGLGMLRSCPAAVEFFKNVAERGRWSTQLMRAYGDYKNHCVNEAYMQYAFLAELGYEVAQSNAAFLLDRGDVTIFHDRNEELLRAFYYWKRAAAQGYSNAQVKLGDYYYYGWGTNIDFETAAALYRKASEQQYNAQAMFNLGYMHEQGLGMKKDWHLAKRLYDLAAETNADAKVPVALALMKLHILTKIESIKETPFKFIFYLDESIAANWDLYVIAVLTLLLGVLTYTLRNLQNEEQRLAQEIEQDQQVLAHLGAVGENDANAAVNAAGVAPNPANNDNQQATTQENVEQNLTTKTPPSPTSENSTLRHRAVGGASTSTSSRETDSTKNNSSIPSTSSASASSSSLLAASSLANAARSSTADPTD